jgi:hypothetical protein
MGQHPDDNNHLSKVFERLTERMNSQPRRRSSPSSKQEPQQETSGPQFDPGAIKEQFGFDRNDPNVTVQFVTGSGATLEDMFKALFGSKADSEQDPETAGDAGGGTASANQPGGEPYVEQILNEVHEEIVRAMQKHPKSFNSPHEGYAVIQEELDELWETVKADFGRATVAREEAIQVAAMAVRYVLDLIGKD